MFKYLSVNYDFCRFIGFLFLLPLKLTDLGDCLTHLVGAQPCNLQTNIACDFFWLQMQKTTYHLKNQLAPIKGDHMIRSE